MATRTTRSSAAKEAAFLASEREDNVPQQLSSPPATPSSMKKKATPKKHAVAPKKTLGVKKATAKKGIGKKEPEPTVPTTPASAGKKRKRASAVKVEEDINELPHNLGKLAAPSDGHVKEEANAPPQTPAKSRGGNVVAADMLSEGMDVVVKAAADVDTPNEEPPNKKTRKTKANPYGLTPGETPYPDWPHPTPEECQKVNDLLSEAHGKVNAPATIPAPSLTVSGCGEVPSVLDALIRTLLSAATTGANSSRAFQGLVEKFGLLQKGIGKGSVNWDNVRRADFKDLFEAIKSGGLAKTKSQRIKEILDMVYDENTTRRDRLVEAENNKNVKEPMGAENETEDQKEAEIMRADEHVLSLDHLHALSSDDALNTLIKYPGIGTKTASCVLLFCMQRPSFAVDTHVFRLCKWLNWVPPDKATRNSTYSHCEVRVPDELKYPLHQLLIRHGKTCPRCRAATGEGVGDWAKGCAIEHLVKRTGKKKGGVEGSPIKKKAGKKGKKGKKKGSGEESEEPAIDDGDEEGEEGELSDNKDGDE